MEISNLPPMCPCGGKLNIQHSMSCKKGGFVTIRHSDLREPDSENIIGSKYYSVYATTPNWADNCRVKWIRPK